MQQACIQVVKGRAHAQQGTVAMITYGLLQSRMVLDADQTLDVVSCVLRSSIYAILVVHRCCSFREHGCS